MQRRPTSPIAHHDDCGDGFVAVIVQILMAVHTAPWASSSRLTSRCQDVPRRHDRVGERPEPRAYGHLMSLADHAEATARNLLADPLPRRWAHTQGVAATARTISGLLGENADLITAAAWLHDIGYAPAIAVTGFHPLDGARHLRDAKHADDLLCRLVANHTAALTEAAERGLADDLAHEFPSVRSNGQVQRQRVADLRGHRVIHAFIRAAGGDRLTLRIAKQHSTRTPARAFSTKILRSTASSDTKSPAYTRTPISRSATLNSRRQASSGTSDRCG